jgi:hypothetical protein
MSPRLAVQSHDGFDFVTIHDEDHNICYLEVVHPEKVVNVDRKLVFENSGH